MFSGMKKVGVKLSPTLFEHFPWSDFACKCCGVILVHPRFIVAYSRLVEFVNPSRVIVHSGYRCTAHNREIGGSSRSRHMFGMALDFHIVNMTLEDMHEIVCLIPEFKGIGQYPKWNNPGLHADVRTDRKEWTWTQ